MNWAKMRGTVNNPDFTEVEISYVFREVSYAIVAPTQITFPGVMAKIPGCESQLSRWSES
jgi:hypothetical protein